MVKLAGAWKNVVYTLRKPSLPNHGVVASSCFCTLAAKRVGTHSGTFHCDEALACFMLRLTQHFSNAHILRTRNPNVLETLDAVVDVGGVYDPKRHRYDHHQRGFDEVLGHGFATKLSSAGLVYKHYGLEIIAKVLQLDEGHPHVHQLYKAVYRNFVESPERENEAFHRAMSLAGDEFLDNVNYYAKSWLPARSIVMECLAARETIDSSGEIIKLTRPCPWKFHIHELEKEMEISPSIKYVLYPDDRSKKWRLQAVVISPARFESRKPLPSPWRGLENDKLSEVAGIPGCAFVHMSGFIGGNQTYDGALAMARASLKA
nr:UPF0160 protein MYG1, mitochondrial isoform X2 [Arachis hypogaea]